MLRYCVPLTRPARERKIDGTPMDRLTPAVEKRHGPSISQKMIIQACAVIVLIVFLFGALNIINVGRVYDQTTRQQEVLQRKSLQEVGAATLGTLAASSRTFFEQSNDNDLRAYVSQLARSSDLISAIYVLDPNHGLVAHSDSGKNPKEGHPPVNEESWKTVLELWKARKDDPAKQDPLITSHEFTGTEGRLALFALPVFPAGVPATVKASLDPEAAVKPYGYVVLGLTFSYLERSLVASKAQKEKDTRDTGLKTAFFGALFVVLGALLAIVQGLRIAKPIKMLAWRADQIARGDLETRVEVTSTDEIGMLGENFNYMADQLVVLLKQTAEKATLEKELEVARTIQETLVPSNDTVERQSIKLSGYFQPASQCGGDWWSYHDLDDGKVLVVIGDVTGHGVPSAMITAAAKAACDVARAVTNNNLGCSQLLEIMNHAIFESAKRKFVMTCFASVVDTKNRTITYANAGHNFPYLYRQQNGRGEFGSLMTRGNRLGDLPESTYAAKSMDLLPGDVLIWYTDGIIECENEQGEEYGEKRFRSSIRRAAHLEPAEMRDTVVNASMQFFGEKPRKDDITMVVARVY
jgi:serine phosphatase RsbU (regulator of sigma subunit)